MTDLPIIGQIPHALVVVAILWSIVRHACSWPWSAIKLPGLEFRNQRVEAAYRKELVYGEDNASRARPANGCRAVRQRPARTTSGCISTTCISTSPASATCRPDNIFPYIVLGPTIVAGKITLGAHEADPQCVRPGLQSFQYLVNSWTTIVELSSIYKRLRAFEAMIVGEPLPDIDRRYMEREETDAVDAG